MDPLEPSQTCRSSRTPDVESGQVRGSPDVPEVPTPDVIRRSLLGVEDPKSEVSGRDRRSLLGTGNRVSEVQRGAVTTLAQERGVGHRPKPQICPETAHMPGCKLSYLFIIFLLGIILMLLLFPPHCETGSIDPCQSCIKTVRTGSKISQTLIYQSKYACQGTKKNCQFHNVSYSACQEQSRVICFDPKENPVQWWLNVYHTHGGGKLITRALLRSPSSRATITLEPCALVSWPTCGDLAWQRSYALEHKYICPGTPQRGKADCKNLQYAHCPYWSCVSWATWQGPGKSAQLTKVSVKTDCAVQQCNYVNFTIYNPQEFVPKFGPQFGIGISGKGGDPLGLFYLKIAQLTEPGHTLQEQFFSEFWEEMHIPFQVPEIAKNLFITFAETVAENLNITNCYVCGGTQVGDQWPWEAAELNVSIPYNETNVINPHSQWMLKTSIVGRWCVQRIVTGAPRIGQMPCESMTILNDSQITQWPNSTVIPPNNLWPQQLKARLTQIQPNNQAWKAPQGLYWICGKYAYSELPEPWEGTCTLGEIRPSFFLIPLSDGERLGHPLYTKKKRAVKIGDWEDDEWPPERIIHYYGPATWAQDGSYGYRTPIYMLNRIIRLQAVLEIITNETARALTALSKTQTQLRNAVYQNRLALDYLLAAEGGVCGKFNLTNCCLHIDDNGKVVEEVVDKIVRLAHVPVQTWKGFEWAEGLGPWFQWIGGLKGMMGIITMGVLLCLVLPCLVPLLVNGLRNMMEQIADRRSAAHIMALHEYSMVPTQDGDTP